MGSQTVVVRPLCDADLRWAERLLDAELGGRHQARRGELIDVLGLPGLVAEREGVRVGLLTYRPAHGGAELEAIVSGERHDGVGVLPFGCARNYRAIEGNGFGLFEPFWRLSDLRRPSPVGPLCSIDAPSICRYADRQRGTRTILCPLSRSTTSVTEGSNACVAMLLHPCAMRCRPRHRLRPVTASERSLAEKVKGPASDFRRSRRSYGRPVEE